MNPDIRITSNPFPSLIQSIIVADAALAAPMVFNFDGELEDSFRKWITPLSFIKRYFRLDSGAYDKPCNLFEPDWIAGMFLLFKKVPFSEIGGFDESYFLYCEDMDLCLRLHLANHKLVIDPFASVEHDARRSSRKKIKYTIMHFKSLIRFWKNFFIDIKM
jgi:GT2 family glycosyltransferase